jgi:hypothetical protein
MEGARCGGKTAMPEQELNTAQVRPGFEQMRGKAVAQRVGTNRLGQPGLLLHLVADPLDLADR